MKNMVETAAGPNLAMKAIFAICAFVLAVVLMPVGTAHAASYSIPSNAQDSGTNGGCTWYVTSASASSNPGQLVIYPTNGTSGTLADIKEDSSPWIYSTAIQSIYIADGVKTSSTFKYAFRDCTSLTTANVANLDTSAATTLAGIFHGCKNLETVEGLEKWNISKATSLNGLFAECNALKSLDLSKWNCAEVTTIVEIFERCYNLKSIVLPEGGMPKLQNANSAFHDCQSLTSVNVSSLVNPNLSVVYYMFSGCYDLTEIIGYENMVTNRVTDVSFVFANCRALPSLDVSEWDVSNVTDFASLFGSCRSITSIEGLDTWNTTKGKNFSNMFSGCWELPNLTLGPNFKTLNGTDLRAMFMEARKLQVLDISMFDTTSATNMGSFFKDMPNLRQVTLGSKFSFTGNGSATNCVLPTPDPAYIPGATGNWQAVGSGTVSAPAGKVYAPADVPSKVAETYVMEATEEPILAANSSWYAGSTAKSSIVTINVVDSYEPTGSEKESWDASAEQDGSVMAYVSADGKTLTIAGNGSGYIMANEDSTGAFRDFTNMTSFNGIGLLDTSETTSLCKLFMNCEKLTSLPDLESLSTSKVVQFDYLFYQCESLPSADLSAWDFSSAEDIAHLFDFCYAVSSIKLPSEVMPNLKYVEQAFNDCESLTALDVSCLASGKLVWATSLFQGCSNLSELEGYENLITSSTTQMACIFSGCNSLTTLSLENWNTENVDSLYGVFSNCKSLTSLTGLDQWDVSNVTNMRATFNDVSKLTTIEGITNWDVSNVEIFDKTFSQNDALVSLDLSGWNTDSGETFNYMFGESVSLKVLDISGFDTEVANDLKGMFTLNRCLQQVTLGEKFSFTGNGSTSCVLPTPDPTYIPGATGKWQAVGSGTVSAPAGKVYAPADVPSKVAETYVMEVSKIPMLAANNSWYKGSADRSAYTAINIVDSYNPTGSEKESWDASAEQDGSVMAYVSADGKTLTIAGNGSGYIKANADSKLVFDEFSSVTAINGLSLMDTSDALDMSGFFADNNCLTSVEGIENWDVSSCTSFATIFSKCTSLTSIDLSKWDMSSAETIGDLVFNCVSLVDLKTPTKLAENLVDAYHAFESCEKLERVDVSFMCSGKLENIDCLFQSCRSLKTIVGYETLVTASTEDMGAVFNCCSKIEYLDLSQWVTDNANSFDLLFGYTYNLTTIDGLENWNVGNVEDMSSTFISCRVTDLSGICGWDVSNVETFDETFASAVNLTNLDLSSWSTDSAKDMGGMFNYCPDLVTLKLGPGFSTENVTDFGQFLNRCNSIEVLDISMVDTSAASDMTDFFTDMVMLRQISLGSTFSFTGNGSTSCVLPTPDPQYIAGAIGKWQAVGAGTVEKPAGTIYLPGDVPSNVFETYVMPLTTISVDVPVKVTLAASADGTWCTPTATANKIINHSYAPVSVVSAEASSVDGFTMLTAANVASSTASNVFGGTITAGAGNAQDLTSINTSADVWTMAAETDSDDSDLISLQLAGSIGNVEGTYFTEGAQLFDITYTFELAL